MDDLKAVEIAEEWLSLAESQPEQGSVGGVRFVPICETEIKVFRTLLDALRERGELMGAMLANLDGLDDYMKQPERGGYGVECAVCMNEWLEPADHEVMERARAALTGSPET